MEDIEMTVINAKTLKGDHKKVYFSGPAEEFKLKFNLNALYFLEQQYGDINIALEEVKGGKIKSLISITTAALSAGMNRTEPFTEDEVADMIEIEDLEPLAKALEDMLGKAKADDATPSEQH